MNIAFIVVFMFTTNAMLATIIVAGLPVFVLVIVLISSPASARHGRMQSNKNSNYNAYLAESIDGVRAEPAVRPAGGKRAPS